MNATDEVLVEAWTEAGGELGGHPRARWVEAFRGAITRGREAWPSLELDEAKLVAALARCVPAGDTPEQLTDLRLDALYLTTACALGDDDAASVFVSRYRREVERALNRFADDRAFRSEVTDEVFDKLLVGTPTDPPRIEAYRGRGDLGRWVHVAATRTAVDRTRGRDRRAAPAGERELLDGLDDEDDPELRYLKDRYRTEFRAAFEHAAASLTDRERRLLRERVVFGLGVVQIASLHDTSKSTAARWIAAARARLVEAVHEYLQTQLEVGPDELRSLMKLASTRMDISVARILERGP